MKKTQTNESNVPAPTEEDVQKPAATSDSRFVDFLALLTTSEEEKLKDILRTDVRR